MRKSLDRRRLEEAFLLYAVLKVHFEYDLKIDHVDYDRNVLVEKVIEPFRERFLEKWSGKFDVKHFYFPLCSCIMQRNVEVLFG
jgi:hypothetical protein